jgi:Bacterial Ig-like domain
MERRMKKLIIPFIILILLVSCQAPTALLDTLEDDVKAANKLYLEILSISPDENQLFTNPGAEVRIEFDRAIDLSSIEELVKVIDAKGESFGTRSDWKGLEYNFDEKSNILTVAANPYLDGLEQYTIKIFEGLRGKDGSSLRDALSWSFTTNDDPRGYVYVEGYTKESTVTVNLFSEGATFYALAASENSAEVSTDWIAITSNPMEITGVSVPNSNAANSYYVKFRDGMINEARSANVSRIESATVIHDTIPPVISMSSATLYGNDANDGNPTATATVSDTVSGIGSYLWEENLGASNLSFATPAGSSCVVTTPAAEGASYTIKLTATDGAGNDTTATRTVTRDTIAPSIPNIDTSPSSNITSDTIPNYTLSAGTGGISTYQYSINDGSWYSYPPIKGGPVMNYGNNQTIEFRGRDLAGNWSVSTGTDSYIIYPSTGTSPDSGDYISGDIVWVYTGKSYPSGPSYFKAYFGSSTRSMPEITLPGKVKRIYPFIDTSELTLSSLSTYYWKFEAYNSSNIRLYTSPTYNFRTSFIKF